MDKIKKQAVVSKQLDTFFEENDFLTSGDVPLFRRFFLAIWNNL
jgi:hypothetical protein